MPKNTFSCQFGLGVEAWLLALRGRVRIPSKNPVLTMIRVLFDTLSPPGLFDLALTAFIFNDIRESID
jgi:hypothetical protein